MLSVQNLFKSLGSFISHISLWEVTVDEYLCFDFAGKPPNVSQFYANSQIIFAFFQTSCNKLIANDYEQQYDITLLNFYINLLCIDMFVLISLLTILNLIKIKKNKLLHLKNDHIHVNFQTFIDFLQISFKHTDLRLLSQYKLFSDNVQKFYPFKINFCIIADNFCVIIYFISNKRDLMGNVFSIRSI